MSLCRGWSRHFQGRRWSVQRQVRITQQCGLTRGSSSPLGMAYVGSWATVWQGALVVAVLAEVNSEA